METKECISQGTESMNPCKPPKERFSLWGIVYRIVTDEGQLYRGSAVVCARDAQHAQQILKTTSAFNGSPQSICIEATAQIPTITESGLCIEAYTDGMQTRINYGG